MTRVTNPSHGADIVDYSVDGMKYTVLVGQFLDVDDKVAEYLRKIYGFLTIAPIVEVIAEVKEVILEEPKVEAIKEEVIEEVVPPPVEETTAVVASEEVMRFCTDCDSKGVRHKKVCPKYIAI